jgi:hypothetical protein
VTDITTEFWEAMERAGSKRPTPAREAAAAITPEDLVAFFAALEAANKLWDDPIAGERGAAVAALAAVTHFVSGLPEFYRPLAILAHELQNAPAPAPGNILPPSTRGQTLEASRRQTVNEIKAAAAYVTRQLAGTKGRSLKAARLDVATILVAYRFPLADYYNNNGAPKSKAQFPSVVDVAKRLEGWCKKYPKDERAAGKVYKEFCANLPAGELNKLVTEDADYIVLVWLNGRLKAAGFTPAK